MRCYLYYFVVLCHAAARVAYTMPLLLFTYAAAMMLLRRYDYDACRVDIRRCGNGQCSRAVGTMQVATVSRRRASFDAAESILPPRAATRHDESPPLLEDNRIHASALMLLPRGAMLSPMLIRHALLSRYAYA